MNETTRRLLAYKNLGTVVFNDEFVVSEINATAESILKPISGQFLARDLLEIFPEFIGSEEDIKAVLGRKALDFRLDYVNRVDAAGQLHYLNLLVLPEDERQRGLLVIEDVTPQAMLLQELNQKKYELLFYRSHAAFRKKFLSESILGNSPAIQQLRSTIQKLGKVPNTTVLLLGESGTGKNLAARVIHYSSMPSEAPFVDINCAALPENLIESELFGYEKGAFTHATVSRRGLLQEAESGTIFLDEIGELPLNLQAKLLSVLEAKKFRRLGSNAPIEVRARVIAATNRDLPKEVAEKRFRKDLYYRLDVVSLTLPPLRNLGEDILIIADHLVTIFNIEFKKQVKGFTQSARGALLNYSWPGNVRELSNCLERAMIFIEEDLIDAPDLIIGHGYLSQADPEWTVPPTGLVLEDVERQLIISALKQAGDNKSKAARLLGLTRDTLRYRMEKHKLTS